MSKPDGGPAFPVGTGIGMTLRDYMAAAAMQGDLANDSVTTMVTDAAIAKRAELYYRFADAMLKERKK